MFKVEEGSEGNNTVNKGATDAKAFQRESYGGSERTHSANYALITV